MVKKKEENLFISPELDSRHFDYTSLKCQVSLIRYLPRSQVSFCLFSVFCLPFSHVTYTTRFDIIRHPFPLFTPVRSWVPKNEFSNRFILQIKQCYLFRINLSFSCIYPDGLISFFYFICFPNLNMDLDMLIIICPFDSTGIVAWFVFKSQYILKLYDLLSKFQKKSLEALIS